MIGRFRDYAREHGVSAALQKGVGEVRRRTYSTTVVTLLVKDLDAVTAPRRPADIEVVPLESSHLAGLSELNRRRGRQRVDRRFSDYVGRGIPGFVGLRDGEVLGYYWWCDCGADPLHPDLDWLGDSLQIEPGDAYGSDFYLLPEARGGNVANAFLYGVESGLAARGFRRLWGCVETGNREARWIYSCRGYLPMGDVSIHQFGSHRRVTGSPDVRSSAA